jgi:tetratricopeptide (TPR) repeat protein
LSAIVERLGGYPLAIEVVAGQTESRTLGDIWNDLVKIPKNVLEGKDELTGEPRGVWTSLGFSYTVLPAPAQTLFCRMGVFLAPATAEDVEAVVGEDGGQKTEDEGRKTEDGGRRTEDEGRMLDVLVRRSLVRMREGAYALLPIVREYALSQLEKAGGDVRELHVRAVQHYAQKGTLEGALIASEHLFELAARYGARRAAEVFVKYVKGFYGDLVTRGYWAEARRKAEQMIVVARALGDKVTEAQAIGDLGTRYQDIGEYARAAELHRQAQEALAASGDKRGVAVILHQQAILAQGQGDYTEARRLYGESLKIEEELGDKQGIANTLHALGNVAYLQGDYAEARRLYGESLKIKEELGDKSGIALTLWGLAMIHQNQGDYKDAVETYEKALQVFDELGDKKNRAGVLHQLGILAQRQGDYAEARQLYGESLKIAEELGNKQGIASTLGQMGQLARAQGQLKDALGYFLRAFAIFDALHSPYRELARKLIVEIRQEVGEEVFGEWVKEMSQ